MRLRLLGAIIMITALLPGCGQGDARPLVRTIEVTDTGELIAAHQQIAQQADTIATLTADNARLRSEVQALQSQPQRASRSGTRPRNQTAEAPNRRPEAPNRLVVGGRTVSSTAYCLTGRMANGRRAHRGAVAANAWPLGTRLQVSASPYGPGVFTVEDRIGSGSQLDFAMPGDCAGARRWGRRSVAVTPVA